MKKAFTMVELIFVIVIIGILSAIAIPKLSSTVDAAYIAKGKSTLAVVRTAIATQRQKRILSANFDVLTIYNAPGRVFTRFTDINGSRILNNDLPSCTNVGCWNISGSTYTYYRGSGVNCSYSLINNRFVDGTTGGCTELEN